LAHFADRTMIDGSAGVMVSLRHVQNFSLALNELATNAAKYGALSNENGKVDISWRTVGDGNDNRLIFKWKETGGPPVVAPNRHGFGTSLLKGAFTDVRIDYSAEGLICEIDLLLGDGESSTINSNLTSANS
jgi:two-component sensor histidine kinase